MPEGLSRSRGGDVSAGGRLHMQAKPRALSAHFLLRGPAPNRPWTGAGRWPGGGAPALRNSLLAAVLNRRAALGPFMRFRSRPCWHHVPSCSARHPIGTTSDPFHFRPAGRVPPSGRLLRNILARITRSLSPRYFFVTFRDVALILRSICKELRILSERACGNLV